MTERQVSQKAIAAISSPATVIDAGIRNPVMPNTSTMDGMNSSIPSGSHTKNGSANRIPVLPMTRRARRLFLRPGIEAPVV